MSFLPNGTKEPIPVSNYLKWADGANTFRVLSDAVTGHEAWSESKEGKKPLRFKDEDSIPAEYAGETKYFWAFVVYNREAERIQILEITQVGIRKAILALMKNPKWGDPHEYDLVVTRSGEGMDTEYSVAPDPKEEIESEVLEAYKNSKINIEALFAGEDPFSENKQNLSVKVKKSKEERVANEVDVIDFGDMEE